MKKLIILLAITTCFTMQGSTQNYLSIKPDAITYFQGINNTNIFPIRIDSTNVHGDTTEYFSFYMIQPIPNTLYYTIKGTPWIGEKMVDCGNGINLFFNQENDTINIKTNANLLESWKIFSYTNGNYIEATISNVSIENFIGLSDSVKTISLQLKDSNNNNITDTLNSYQLKLSKNYGFITIADFYDFPFNIIFSNYYYNPDNLLTMAGINNPQMGWQNITLSDVYTMQQGDEIHYYRYHTYNVFEEKYIHKYLSAIYDTLSDSVFYTIERCGYYHQFMPPPSTSHYHDTTQYSYLIDTTLNSLPFEPIFQNGSYCYYIKNNNTAIKSYYNYYQYSLDTIVIDPCWEAPSCEAYINVYYKDLGYVTNYYSNNNGSINSAITYYNLQGNEWGTPYICDSLLSKSPTNLYLEPGINIFPNPSSNSKITIKSNEFIKSFALFNNLGEIILTEDNINSKTIVLSTGKLQSGIYFIKTYCNNEQIFINKLLINN